MSFSFCLPHPVAVSAFMICRGLCACTEVVWMCVLYVSFWSKVRPRTFGRIESFAHIECYSDEPFVEPFATVLFTVCSAVTVECCVLYPCGVGVFGMVAVM